MDATSQELKRFSRSRRWDRSHCQDIETATDVRPFRLGNLNPASRAVFSAEDNLNQPLFGSVQSRLRPGQARWRPANSLAGTEGASTFRALPVRCTIAVFADPSNDERIFHERLFGN